MVAVIDTVWRSTLKGSWGVRPRFLFIDTVVGVQDDRRCAVRRRPGNMQQWSPKGVYHVCMNTPQMAPEKPHFVQGETESGESRRLHPGYLTALAERLGIKDDPQVQYADETYSLHDTKGAYVSILNIATVDALSDYMGVFIDPRRFRMNVWIRGLAAFEELTWVDKYPGTREIIAGECRFRVDDACERCKAPEANPETGDFDLEIQNALDLMMTKRGYKSPHRGTPRVMGILAQPLENGIIRRGDSIEFLN